MKGEREGDEDNDEGKGNEDNDGGEVAIDEDEGGNSSFDLKKSDAAQLNGLQRRTINNAVDR